MKTYILIIVWLSFTVNIVAQTNNNGKLDLITEFSSIKKVKMTMDDGTLLSTHVYLPEISDSISATIDVGGTNYTIEIVPKGTQLFVYDSVNGSINTNPYQLPTVFTRTPYDKDTFDVFGIYMNFLGFNYILQDMRGRYDSEGVYHPMYSDGWSKNEYHPNTHSPLDITLPSDPRNANKHEDGKNSIYYILDSLNTWYDLDGDGIKETNDRVSNGSIAMFGGSALGNTQYQAASCIQNDTRTDGIKGLVPIVATNEHFNSVLQHNGVFRQALVEGWITGQLNHNVDTNLLSLDSSIHNNIHTIFDYGSKHPDSIIATGVDFASSLKDHNGYTGMYPNSKIRSSLNASFAPINALGNADSLGTYSRYSNLEVPIYHLTGWWDIFIDGQIDTYNKVMQHTSLQTQKNQKLVIGPWTHDMIATDSSGDLKFPNSIYDIKVGNREVLANSFNELLDGELVSWFRYLLNYDSAKYLGEPKVLLKESSKWQNIGAFDIRIPAQDHYISYSDFINFLSGYSDLKQVPVELDNGSSTNTILYDIPTDTNNRQPGSSPVNFPASEIVDYTNIPNIRYYVTGPINDGIGQNSSVGNYWESCDHFPRWWGVKDSTLYLHSNGSLNGVAPITPEAPITYLHDPEDPVKTVGGGNLVIELPHSGRDNTGPLNLADSNIDTLTLNRPDVIHFETGLIQDSLKIVGIPSAKIYASSNPTSGPSGPTDTDFFIRILDVYPNGKEIFVVEGAVNARARDYAKQLATGTENINIPYSNINPGQVYEYEFNLLPIAYTFGHNHKMKVLISSSNWPRYQSNPNIPIENGDFFRRTPGDGKTYNYLGNVYSPRTAQQSIQFSPNYPTQITIPYFDGYTGIGINENLLAKDNWNLFPNPASSKITVDSKTYKDFYDITIYDISGKEIITANHNFSSASIDINRLKKGMYIVLISNNTGILSSKKLLVN